MAQLMMLRRNEEAKGYSLPDGCTCRNFQGNSDIMPWVEICKNGLLGDDAGAADFHGRITDHKDLVPETDLFFVEKDGKAIATIAAIFHPETNSGHLHMVSVAQSCRGMGLGNFINCVAIRKLLGQGVDYITLTTDEWRKAAVKSYLTAGFLPVEYDEGMEERWLNVMKEYGIGELEMVYPSSAHFKALISSAD